MDQSTGVYQSISAEKKQWITDQIKIATVFVAAYSSSDARGALTIDGLDRAYAAWLSKQPTDMEQINRNLTAIGIAFGSFLVHDAGFRWVIAKDNRGHELAVIALPNELDLLVYPANLVAEHWERHEINFMRLCFDHWSRQIREHEAQKARRPFWRRLLKQD